MHIQMDGLVKKDEQHQICNNEYLNYPFLSPALIKKESMEIISTFGF